MWSDRDACEMCCGRLCLIGRIEAIDYTEEEKSITLNMSDQPKWLLGDSKTSIWPQAYLCCSHPYPDKAEELARRRLIKLGKQVPTHQERV